MAIKIKNLRIEPYSQKDVLKAVFGDSMTLTFSIPHVDGESYVCGLDSERFVYPPSRPLCAYTNVFVRDGENVTFTLNLNTSRFRDFVNGLRKPMPVWIQVVRVVLGKCETIVLDDILALPSVVDGANTVCEGDPLAELLDGKLDKPYVEGVEGQVLTMGADGHYAWSDLPEIPEQEQADWEQSDSTAYSYIKNKPIVYTQSETNALLDEKADKTTTYTKTETDSLLNEKADKSTTYTKTETDGLLNGKADKATTLAGYGITDAYTKTQTDGLLDAKADKATTYTKTETDSLLNAKADKATTLAGYGITDAYTKTEVDNKIASVYKYKGTVSDYSDLPSSGQEVGDVYNVETADAEHHIKAGDNVAWNGTAWDVLAGEIVFPEQVQADWDESDSSEKSFIQNKPVLATVALTGSYTDLNDKPHIPADQVQADYDESDSQDVSFIRNKPIISTVGHTGSYDDLLDKPDLSVYVEKEAGKGLSSNDFTDNDVSKLNGIESGAEVNVQADYEESDSQADSFIQNKPIISTVGHTGSYNDLTDKPHIPADQVQADWDESDSTSPAYIQNKPEVGGSVPDATDYLCFTAAQANSTVRLDRVGSPTAISIKYSIDKAHWTAYTWTESTGTTITLTNVGDCVWFKGDNNNFSTAQNDRYQFAMSGKIKASGNVMSLVDSSCRLIDLSSFPAYVFTGLFMDCSSLITSPNFPATVPTNYCYFRTFYGCTELTTSPYLPMTNIGNASYSQMFYDCRKLNYLKIGLTSWGDSYLPYFMWLTDVSSTGTFVCPSSLEIIKQNGTYIPTNWTVIYSDLEKSKLDAKNSVEMSINTSTASSIEVSPSGNIVQIVTVNSTLTLSASATASTNIAYAEVVLDIASNATVTAGTNMTFEDTLEAGKRNICVVRWSGGVAKLYVTIVEDLPQA